MSIITVCKDCPDRDTACHDRCDKYKEQKQKLEEQKMTIRNNAKSDNDYINYMKNRKIKKGTGRKW